MHELAIKLLQCLDKSVVSPVAILELLQFIFTHKLGCHSIPALVETDPDSFPFYASLLNIKRAKGITLETSFYTNTEEIDSIRYRINENTLISTPIMTEPSEKNKLILSISVFTPIWTIQETFGGYHRFFQVDLRTKVSTNMMGMTSARVQTKHSKICKTALLPINMDVRLVLIMPSTPAIFDFISSLGTESLEIMADIDETMNVQTVLFPQFEFESTHTDLSKFLFDQKGGLNVGSPVDTQILYGTRINMKPTHKSHDNIPYDAMIFNTPFVYLVQHVSSRILWMGSVVRPAGFS